MKSALAPVGSDVVISEFDAAGSRRKKENASTSEPGEGELSVSVMRHETVEPSVTDCCSSLKNTASVRVIAPGSEPLTDPVVSAPPRVAFVVKFEIVTPFDGGPPSTKSK